MRQLVILLVFVLFIAGCRGCPEYQTNVNGRCCVDSNENNICDLDEKVSNLENTNVSLKLNETADVNSIADETQAVNVIVTTTTTTVPVYFDCDHTELVVVKMTYHGGNNSKVNALLLNSGQVKIKGFRLKVYDDNGLAVNQIFPNEPLNISDVKEFNFEFWNYDLINENNTVNMITIAPKLTSMMCSEQRIYDFKLVDH